MKNCPVVILLFFALLFFHGCSMKNNKIEASGTVEATEINMAAKVSGRLENFAKEGQKVKKGEKIIWLDREELLQQVAQAEAAFRAAGIQLGQSKKSVELQTSQVQNQIKIAQSGLSSAEAQVNQTISGSNLQITQTDTQLTQAKAKFEESLSAYEQAKKAFELQIADTESKISQAQANYDGVSSKLQMLLNGARPQEREQTRAAYEQALSNYENSAKDLERAKNLFKEGVIPQQQLDKAQTLYDNVSAALEIAKEQMSLVQEGPRSEEIEVARQNVAQAEAVLESAKATEKLVEQKKKQVEIALQQVEEAKAALELAGAGGLQNDIKTQQVNIARAQYEQAQSNYKLARDNWKTVEIKKKDVEAAKALLEQKEAALNLARTQLNNSIVLSPINGTVKLKVSEIGELVPAGSTILKLVDLENIWISVYIPEDKYGKIKLNDKVRVTVDSWPGEVFDGYVSYIASEAQFTPKSIQTKQDRTTLTYEVKVTVNNKEQKLIPGMPADVEILTTIEK